MPTTSALSLRCDVRLWRPAVLSALAAAAFLAFGVTITVVTNRGTVELEAFDDDVQVAILRGGKEVNVLDSKTGSKVTLRAGEYPLKPLSDRTDVQLNRDTFIMTRGGKSL